MELTGDRPHAKLATHDHGTLATLHPDRGADLVPVVYALLGDLVGIPVDRVKPKASTRLRREANLRSDPRATLLFEHWDPADWTRLWWVRAHLRWEAEPAPGVEEALAARLAARYRQYRDQPFERVLVLRILDVAGWSAEAP